MEGHDYNKRLSFEYVEDIPVYAFTAEELPQERKSPSAVYFEVFLKGLKETYPEKSELSLQVYLFSCGAVETEDMCVLSFIWKSDHGVSLQTMADAAECPCITHVRKSVKKLLDFHLIKQDSRSQRAGNQVQDTEAVFYTRKEKRDIIDTLLVILR